MDPQTEAVETLQAGDEFENDEREYVGDFEEDEDFEDEEDELAEEIEEAQDQEQAAEQLLQQMQYIRGLEPIARPNGAAGGNNRQPAGQPAVRDWTSLANLPGATQQVFLDLLGQLKTANRQDLTILFLGKGGVGKSSTANSLFGERVANVAPFQSDSAKPVVVTRKAAGFTISVVDTPGLFEGDAVSTTALQQICYVLETGVRPHVVMYFDRLDTYRVEPEDKEVMETITNTFGKQIWQRTILCLTHADMKSPDPSLTYVEFVAKRSNALRRSIGSCGGPSSADLPIVLVENNTRCPENKSAEKILPSGKAWLPAMMGKVVDVALRCRSPYVYSKRLRRGANPNNKKKWLIPLVLIAQVLFKVFVLDRLLEDDGLSGDQYGPYDAQYVKEERERIKKEKEAQKRKAAKKAADESSSSSSDEEEEEEEEDEEEED